MKWLVRALGLCLVLAGCALALSGSAFYIKTSRDQSRYETLLDGDAPRNATRDSGPNWSELLATNAECAAWLRVDRTHVDYPVVAPADADMQRYLDRDFWGQPSLLGCPFLDHRSDADGPHALVYAHHLAGQETMFSELFDAYQQDQFDDLGELFWSTPAQGTCTLDALCALSLDRDDPLVQHFSFDSDEELRSWLRVLAMQASARSPAWERLCGNARRAVTLVTCSSMLSGQRERTSVIFVCGNVY